MGCEDTVRNAVERGVDAAPVTENREGLVPSSDKQEVKTALKSQDLTRDNDRANSFLDSCQLELTQKKDAQQPQSEKPKIEGLVSEKKESDTVKTAPKPSEAKEGTAGKTKDKDGNEVTTFTDDKEKRVKATRFYDGKHGEALGETEYKGRDDQLAKKTDFLNRTEKTFENGSKLTEYTAGDRRNPDPDLVKVFETANGNYKHSEYSGRFDKVKAISEYKNRKDGLERYISREDGTSEGQYKDGTVKKYDKQGEETVIKPKIAPKDETTKSKDKDGNEITTFTNDKEKRVKETRFYDRKHGEALGETEYKGREDQLAKKTDFLNRTEKTFENGSKSTEYTAGDRRNPDPDLVKVFESANGNYKHSEYSGRFDKVKEISEYKNRKDGLEKYISKEDGTSEGHYKDGTIKKYDKKGEETIVKPKVEAKDESTKSKDKDGNEITTFTNDKEKRVKETRFYDRKHGEALGETEYKGRDDQLAKKTDFLNRTEKTFENGGKLTEYNAGDRRNPDPDLVKVFESANGNYKRSQYSGRFDKVKSIAEYKSRADGLEKITSREDGTSEQLYKDGTIKKYDKDGEETIIKPKIEPKVESTKSTDKDGNEVITFSNDKEKRVKETRFYDKKHGEALGETEYKGRDDQLAKKTEFLNRSEKTFENGSKLTEYNPGDRRNPDPDIVKVFESKTGNYKRTEYSGRFDKVKFISEFKNHKDGLVSYTGKEDGSGEYQYQDGTIKRHDKDGNVTRSKKR